MNTKIKTFIESDLFTKFIIYLIVLNGITMGLETSKTFMLSFESYTSLFNQIVITIFTIEILLRIYVYRISFFKDPYRTQCSCGPKGLRKINNNIMFRQSLSNIKKCLTLANESTGQWC